MKDIPMHPLTTRQTSILAFIRDHIATNNYAPTVREIGAQFGITPNGVAVNLKALERKGWIEFGRAGRRKLARTMRIVEVNEGVKA